MQKRSIYFILSAALIINALPIYAQEKTKMLSLTEAIDLSLSNNKNLKKSNYALEEAHAFTQEAKERRLPDLKVSGSYMRLNTPMISGNLLKKMAAGNSGNNGGEAAELKVHQVAFGMANASLPLFSGNRINNGIKAAQLLEKAAEFDVDYQKELVVENTIEAYYNLYKAQTYLKIVQENNKTAINRVKDFLNLEKNGVIPRNDLLSVQLQQKNMDLAILDAENNLKIANYNFDLMLGLDEQTILNVEGLSGINQYVLEPLENYSTKAITDRSDLKAMDTRIDASQVNTKISKGAYLPSLALTGGYVAADIHNMLTVTNAANVGVGLSYNISDLYKTGSKIKQLKAKESALMSTQSAMQDGVKMEIHKAYQDCIESSRKITVLISALELAEENYKIVKNKYDNSLATATELLDADVSKLQANINLEFSKIDHLIAYNKLLRASGQLSSIYTSNLSK